MQAFNIILYLIILICVLSVARRIRDGDYS